MCIIKQQTSQPFFRAIVRLSRIWREIHTLWRETWDDVILKPYFRPENKLYEDAWQFNVDVLLSDLPSLKH